MAMRVRKMRYCILLTIKEKIHFIRFYHINCRNIKIILDCMCMGARPIASSKYLLFSAWSVKVQLPARLISGMEICATTVVYTLCHGKLSNDF